MAEALCIKCGKNPQTSLQMKTCESCRRRIHRRMKQTLKQIFAAAERLRIQAVIQDTVAETIDYQTGKVERIDKQKLVDAGIVRFAGIKPRRVSRVAQTKARAAGIIAATKLRERRRNGGRQQMHAHA